MSFTRTIVVSLGGVIVVAAATRVAGAGLLATAVVVFRAGAAAVVVFGDGLVAEGFTATGAEVGPAAAVVFSVALLAAVLGTTAFVVTALFTALLFIPGDGLLGRESSNALAEPTAHRLPTTIKATNLRKVFI
jgi:hypothetical protein